jgi:hypothetical protein
MESVRTAYSNLRTYMPDIPYFERVGREFVDNLKELEVGIERIGLLWSVSSEEQTKRASQYVEDFITQRGKPKDMKEWRMLRDGVLRRLKQ